MPSAAPGDHSETPGETELPRRSRLWRAVSPTLPVWAFSATLFLLAALMWAVFVRELDPIGTPYRVPWAVIALGHALAETYGVHVQWFRRDTHTFSLSEIPIVLGMFVLSPGGLIAAVGVGATIALLTRKQSPMKLTFNLAQFALGVTVASAIFYSVTTAGNALAPMGIAAAFVAVAANSVVSVLAIATAISLSERQFRYREVPNLLGFNLAGNLANTSIGVITVIMLWRSPSTAWVLLIPSIFVILAYRGYSAMRQRQEGLELLSNTSQLLTGASALGGAVADLLAQALHVFNADVAQLILINERGDAIRSRLGPGNVNESLVPIRFDASEEPWATILSRATVLMQLPNEAHQPLAGVIDDIPVKDGMAIALRGEDGIAGVLAIVNRSDETVSFDATHRRLLEALAAQVTGVWEKGRLEQSVSEFKQVELELSYQANHDPLTGLANRTLFTEKVIKALRAGAEGRSSLAVMFIDLDDFKQVNDRLGHAAGDHLLITIADRIRSCVRATDTPARIGGDEFAVLIEGPEIQQDGRGSAERILATIRREVPIQGTLVMPAASIGVASPAHARVELEELLGDADTAMYAAKGLGKGQVAVFEPSMRAGERERQRLLEELRAALGRNEFVLHYQPIVDLPSGQISGVEALLRWNHPRMGLLDPPAFIDLAEDAGLFAAIGLHALRMACEQSRAWQQVGRAGSLTIGVNVSASQVENATLLDDISEALLDTGCDPKSLMLEVGEATLQHASPSGLNALLNLKQVGVRLAIDDYGTGYSSLGYLTKLPIDLIKIAKPFIDGLSRGAEDVALAKAIVRLGQALGREVIAVGIESEEQRIALQSLGCTLGQGFLYSEAVPARELERLLVRGYISSAGSLI